MNYMEYLQPILRLLLACILGGLIGIERESANRPAGFRTHILVCVGSALVMITSEYLFFEYKNLTNIDPARLGAQVISGIGFLGAGTIIREGDTVRGLTTAASLWAVACIGLAVGTGFYLGGIGAAIIVYLVLVLLKKLESAVLLSSAYYNLVLQIEDRPGQIGKIGEVMGSLEVGIEDIKLIKAEENMIRVGFLIKLPSGCSKLELMDELMKIDGVNSVDTE
ncbi:MAG: MgtC/SapB family protein [Clostridia bacterium]|nr:MgtC/SapB family protein [Clostridia bacterium]